MKVNFTTDLEITILEGGPVPDVYIKSFCDAVSNRLNPPHQIYKSKAKGTLLFGQITMLGQNRKIWLAEREVRSFKTWRLIYGPISYEAEQRQNINYATLTLVVDPSERDNNVF